MDEIRETRTDLNEQSTDTARNNEQVAVETVDNEGAGVTTIDEDTLDGQRLQLLSWLFFERFVEMLIVIPLTIVAISRTSVRTWIEGHFWPLEILAIVLLFTWKALMFIPSLTRLPGCILPKLTYLVILVILHIILGIHFPILFSAPNWSPYYSVLAAGMAAIIYILLSILSVARKVSTKNASLYFWASGTLLVVLLVVSQLVYFCFFSDVSYGWFMLDVGSGLLIALFFTFNYIHISKRCANSKRLEDIVARDGTVSLSEFVSLATLVFHYPFNKEEKKRRRALLNNA